MEAISLPSQINDQMGWRQQSIEEKSLQNGTRATNKNKNKNKNRNRNRNENRNKNEKQKK